MCLENNLLFIYNRHNEAQRQTDIETKRQKPLLATFIQSCGQERTDLWWQAGLSETVLIVILL